MNESIPYQKMYAILCGAASESVELLDVGKPEEARQTLLDALERAEECYLAAE